MRRWLLVLAWLGATAVWDAHAREEARFEDSTTVIAVEVPVHVYRGDEPVRGLTAEQFRVLDDGVERPIVDFEVIDLAMSEPLTDDARPTSMAAVSSSEDALSVPQPARRHFLLLFDLSFIQRENLLRSVRSARQFLDGPLHPSDLVAVGVFGAARGARLLVGFTPNHSQVGGALEALEALAGAKEPEVESASTTRRAARLDPLRLFVEGGAEVAGEIARHTGSEWTDGLAPSTGGLSSGTIADMIEVSTIELIQRKQSEVLGFTDALEQLAAGTAGIEGRKYLVLLSQGFDLPTGSILRGDNIRVINAMDRLVKVFRRAGWVMQGVNVSGPGDQRYGSEVMFKMASETGGELYERFNDLGSAMGRMLRKTSVTYLLTIQAEDIPLDGAFRRLEVKLRDRSRGVRIRHREGYDAPGATPPPESGLSRTLALGQRVLTGDEGGTLTTDVLAVPLDVVGDRRKVAVWIATEGKAFAADQAGDTIGGEVYVYALDQAGEIQDFFTQSIALDRARVADAFGTGSLQVYGSLALPPGAHTLRVLVRSAASHESLRIHAIDVPATTSRERVSPPLFLADATHPLVIVRVAEPSVDATTAAAQYPFRLGDQTFVPQVRPVLSSGVPRRIVVMAQHLDVGHHAVRARVVRDGNEVAGAHVEIVGQGEVDARAGHQLFLQLDAAALEAGAYELEIAVDDTGSGESVAVGVQPFWVAKS